MRSSSASVSMPGGADRQAGPLQQPLDSLAVLAPSQPSSAELRAASLMPIATASPCSQRS